MTIKRTTMGDMDLDKLTAREMLHIVQDMFEGDPDYDLDHQWVELGIKTQSDLMSHYMVPYVHSNWCRFVELCRSGKYASMVLSKERGIGEILQREAPRLKWDIIQSLRNGKYVPRRILSYSVGGLRDVRLYIDKDILTMDWQCVLTYRTPTNEWAHRFYITEREIESVGNL